MRADIYKKNAASEEIGAVRRAKDAKGREQRRREKAAASGTPLQVATTIGTDRLAVGSPDTISRAESSVVQSLEQAANEAQFEDSDAQHLQVGSGPSSRSSTQQITIQQDSISTQKTNTTSNQDSG